MVCSSNKVLLIVLLIVIVVSTVFSGGCGCGSDPINPPVPGNDPPVAVLTATPASGAAPLAVSFDASASTDDSSITKYEFRCDAGEAWVDQGLTPTWSFTYEDEGNCTAEVRVSDDATPPKTDTQTVLITVDDGGPPTGLTDAMAVDIDFQSDEHLVRDSAAVHYSADDKAVLIDRILGWTGSSQSSHTSQAPPELTILVNFASPVDGLGLTEGQITSKVQADMQAEFGNEITVIVEVSSGDFFEKFADERERIADDFELDAKWQVAHDLGQPIIDANLDNDEPLDLDPAWEAALSDYYDAEEAWQSELDASTNLADLPGGSIGLVLAPVDGYGGQTHVGNAYPNGERWSMIRIGSAEGAFNSDSDLILQYISNSAKHQIGLQFGLLEKTVAATRSSQATNPGSYSNHLNPRQLISQLASAYDMQESNAPHTVTKNPAFISVVLNGLGLATGAASVGGWIKYALEETSEVKVRDLAAENVMVELGVTLQMDYEVEFFYRDSWAWSDGAFFELYIVQNEEVLHYERYPEAGYFDKAWSFDDSTEGKASGSIWLCARKWPEQDVTDRIKVYGVVYNDSGGYFPDPHNRWKAKDENGNEADSIPDPSWWGGPGSQADIFVLSKLSDDKDVMSVTTTNPYYINVLETDEGENKNHGEQFKLKFNARMAYSNTYGGFQVFYPDSANVMVNDLDKDRDPDWSIVCNAGELPTFTYTGVKRGTEDKYYEFTATHNNPDPDLAFAYYSDCYGAQVWGKNKVYKTVDGSAVEQEVGWEGCFKKESAASSGCCPRTFSAGCVHQ